MAPATLFGRTAVALVLAFTIFGAIAVAILQYSVVRPHMRLAADELASFLVLSAQVWVELPPFTRPDYEREMLRRHRLRIIHNEPAQPTEPEANRFLDYLERALSQHTGQEVRVHRHPDEVGWLWTDFQMGTRTMRLGFSEHRLQRGMAPILPLLAISGLAIALALSLLLVRRITRPLEVMAEAAQRIGEGQQGPAIPETGPLEIAELAQRFNRMESRIGQLLENRTTLLAGISHDLRTPLARMRLAAELLRSDDNTDLLEQLNDNIEEMETLISQVLTLARGLAQEEGAAMPLAETLAALVDEYRQQGAEIALNLPATATRAVPENTFRRVMANLIENALAYGEGRPIAVSGEDRTDDFVIRVTDHGPGVPETERDKIFEPFHRLEGSRSRATGGSGLGLAIVQQLCTANGWKVSVGDSAESPGAEFAITLPGGQKRRAD